jgi:ABC-type uncharacterized transport system substrate-binding protein
VLAAKAATTTIPIVFNVGEDPVRLGLVSSLSRPGGNVTGNNFFSGELVAKHLEILRELVPAAARVAVLVNPAHLTAEPAVRDAQAAGRTMGLQIRVLNAGSGKEIDAAFATLAHERPDALLVASGPPFATRRVQLVQSAAYHKIPAIYPLRQYVEIGGLVTYGTSLTNAYRKSASIPGVSSRARSPRSCRSCSRRSSNWPSMPRQPGCLASPCRRRCSPAPTR